MIERKELLKETRKELGRNCKVNEMEFLEQTENGTEELIEETGSIISEPNEGFGRNYKWNGNIPSFVPKFNPIL